LLLSCLFYYSLVVFNSLQLLLLRCLRITSVESLELGDLMKKINKKWVGAGIGVALLMASTAFAASYFTRATLEPTAQNQVQPRQPAKTAHRANTQIASAAPMEPRCNDSNVLGYVAGGAAGGLVGNQVGKGKGNTAATIAGTLGGAYLGGQYIPLQNVTCR
jgi:outer membrane lipoprotein SlyB